MATPFFLSAKAVRFALTSHMDGIFGLVVILDVLLYTARNNLFHAVKGLDDPGDKTVAENVYHLLEPWIAPLLEAAKKQSNEVLWS